MDLVYEFVAFAVAATIVHFRALHIGRKRGLREAIRIGQVHMHSLGKISASVSEVLGLIEQEIDQ